MKCVVVLLVLALFAFAGPAYPSGCCGGPACPLCAGDMVQEVSGMCGEPECPVLQPGRSIVSSLYAPRSEEGGITQCRFGVVRNLDAGIAYTWSDEKVLGSVNYLLRAERGSRPALTLGVGSRRTGGADSSAFLIGSKSMAVGVRNLRVSLGLAYTLRQAGQPNGDSTTPMEMTGDSMTMEEGSGSERKAFVIGGAALQLAKRFAGGIEYDGRSVHGVLASRVGSLNVGMMLLEMRDPAISIGYSSGGTAAK